MSDTGNGRSTVERALSIARTGTARSVAEIRTQLRNEGYDSVEPETAGQSIKIQLKKLIAARLAESGTP
ncbi:hypothetical protein KCP91_09245 [Microvirga sp. SRT01]|jgi:hypothetical protein|uniref:Uncharacterized protein n=1 Tax=Sphingomonas longa TaxID=2778730 RepID=A0ABS2D7Q1_9SPHN|nr:MULTISPECIES: hypothetical protein [Alphaproteobacteria]MBM6576558.1 hypothetical protein [Sphingomonas sp. BT552]MBR7709604.1 hypothetical protein [Microvirga sp. SRT01]